MTRRLVIKKAVQTRLTLRTAFAKPATTLLKGGEMSSLFLYLLKAAVLDLLIAGSILLLALLLEVTKEES